jgi:hypothetical protein
MADHLPGPGTPLVVRAADAAFWLDVPVDRVAAIAADLAAWGRHADGQPVYRLARATAPLGRPGRRSRGWRAFRGPIPSTQGTDDGR